LLRCDENKFLIDHVEQWNASNELVRMEFIEPAAGVKFSEFQPVSAFATLQQIYCGNGYAGLGIQIAAENGSIKVTNVFDGSPAKKVGVKTNDVVTRIDNESVNGLTPEQVIEKLRGPANTTVALTIMREGKDKPVELTITREIIQMQSTQIGPSK